MALKNIEVFDILFGDEYIIYSTQKLTMNIPEQMIG